MSPQETHLHQLLDALRSRLLVMAATARQAVTDASKAMLQHDMKRAEVVIDGDCVLDSLENEIDDLSLTILARTQPVARDLRFIMSATRMVLDLERIGDEAVTIAERAMQMQKMTTYDIMDAMTPLCERAQSLLSGSITAFSEGNSTLALSLCRSEDDVAQLEVNVIQHIMDALMEQHIDAWYAMHAILATRALERICRRSANIAEQTYFMVEGLNIKHKAVNPNDMSCPG